MAEVTARANANVALAKYWGKRDEVLNLPFTASLSITLDGLHSTATVSFGSGKQDRVVLNGQPADPRQAERVTRFIDLVRQRAGIHEKVHASVTTNFPVAAGLASSASIFAALAVAASAAAGLSLSEKDLSILARRGSGSAARSIHGGFVEWLSGKEDDGSDSYAVQIAPPEHWPLGVVVAITDESPKKVGSREGMMRVLRESAFFPVWLATHEADLSEIRGGVLQRDLHRVGAASEHNCLKMHAVSMAARPPLLYWNPATIAVMRRVAELRESGLHAYFTIDAGPQVKVICPLAERARVGAALSETPGVLRVLLSGVGGAAQLLDRVRAEVA